MQQKADGVKLAIVEAPEALLMTNHRDLNKTSQQRFGQRAYRFEFTRQNDCSASRLEEIYQLFLTIITDRDYLVSSGEAMQSLYLTCREIMLAGPKADENEWEKQAIFATKITKLLKERADVVIDEVHQGLLQKRKLNYTIGESELSKSYAYSIWYRLVWLFIPTDKCSTKKDRIAASVFK